MKQCSPYKKFQLGRFQKVITIDEYDQEQEMTFICQDEAFFILLDHNQVEIKDHECLKKLTIEETQKPDFWKGNEMLKFALQLYARTYVGFYNIETGDMIYAIKLMKK